MQTESARMSSAAEARFRIDYPNSKPRVVKVIALDPASERLVKEVAQRSWQRKRNARMASARTTRTARQPSACCTRTRNWTTCRARMSVARSSTEFRARTCTWTTTKSTVATR